MSLKTIICSLLHYLRISSSRLAMSFVSKVKNTNTALSRLELFSSNIIIVTHKDTD